MSAVSNLQTLVFYGLLTETKDLGRFCLYGQGFINLRAYDPAIPHLKNAEAGKDTVLCVFKRLIYGAPQVLTANVEDEVIALFVNPDASVVNEISQHEMWKAPEFLGKFNPAYLWK